MKLITPNVISGEIFKIIDEANEVLVLVSPYIKISGWPKLTNRLKAVIERGIDIKAYVRDGQKNLNSIDELQQLGITPYLIPNLHAKLYFNEKDAITTSMNLLKSSDQYSLEVGHKVQADEEYEDIVNYYKKYIAPFESNQADFKTTLEDEVKYRLKNKFPKLKVYSNFQTMKVTNGSNQFEATISKQENGCFLEMITILSSKQFLKKDKLLNDYNFSEEFGLQFIAGEDRSYDMVIGYLDRDINSKRISDVLNEEKIMIADLITVFISNIEAYKKSVR